MRLLATITSVAMLAATLLGCGNNKSAEQMTARYSESPSETPRTSLVPPASATATAKRTRKPVQKTPQTPDNELGLPRFEIEILGQMGELYGYSFNTMSDYEAAKNFAYGMSVACDDFRTGTTLQSAIEADILNGAPPSDARDFNRYLKNGFCPAYYSVGN